MQSVITWEQLLTGITVFLFLYHAIILFVFYRKDLSFLHSSRKHAARSLTAYGSSEAAPVGTEEPDMGLYNQVHELMEDCKPVFQAAVTQQLDKELVIESLRVRLEQYPQLKGTAFQVAVTNHIAQELDHRLSMVLTDDEANGLWR